MARVFSSVFRRGLMKDKVAIVTGGATGIGRAISEEILYLGGSVLIGSRKSERLEAAAAEMRDQLSVGEDRLSHVACNIRKEEDVANMAKFCVEKFGKIDYLVNNGGGQFIALVENVNLKGWNAVVETNLTGTFLATKAVFEASMKDRGGAIVNILVCNKKGFPIMAHSGAARAGVENLSKSLAMEWANYGVRINNVSPGTVYSPTAAANYDLTDFDVHKPFIPFKRLGSLAEISAAVVYLLSPAANFVTGVTLDVDGGQNLGPPMFVVPEHEKNVAYTWETDVS